MDEAEYILRIQTLSGEAMRLGTEQGGIRRSMDDLEKRAERIDREYQKVLAEINNLRFEYLVYQATKRNQP